MDGTGCPLGLKGEAIPAECRILSIVDGFDAMTNDRPYRKAKTKREADPQLIEIFNRVVKLFSRRVNTEIKFEYPE
jgi:HD-GYP domain-containing protein (c-di-GMP phosphodiesterase class II)